MSADQPAHRMKPVSPDQGTRRRNTSRVCGRRSTTPSYEALPSFKERWRWRPTSERRATGRRQSGLEPDEQDVEPTVQFGGAVVGTQCRRQRPHVREVGDR